MILLMWGLTLRLQSTLKQKLSINNKFKINTSTQENK